MQFIPIKTRPLMPPKDDLYAVLQGSLPTLREGDILLITSKVLAIHQGRCILRDDVPDKDSLIREEAEAFVERDLRAKYPIMLTIKHHTLIASAGIDESNANGHYILWPERLEESAREIWEMLRRKHKIEKFGVIITDSHSLPLRWGVLGVALGFWGFEPTIDLRGRADIFGRPLTMTQQNVPDALAALGVLLMGEADECTPLLLVRDFTHTRFTEADMSARFWVDEKDDMYAPLLTAFKR